MNAAPTTTRCRLRATAFSRCPSPLSAGEHVVATLPAALSEGKPIRTERIDAASTGSWTFGGFR
jgi:hypothetical protein